MRALRKYVEKTEVCISLANELSELTLVQAVHVEPHPLLLARYFERRIFDFDDLDPRLSYPYHGDWDAPVDPGLDFDNLGPLWPYAESKRLPLLVRIHCAPDRVSESVENIRAEISAVARRYSKELAVQITDRARCVAAISTGAEVLGDQPGTFGGCLSLGSDVYGLTCAHVVGSAPDVRDKSGKKIGRVVASSLLKPLVSGDLCKPKSQNGNSMDAALVQLEPHHAPMPQNLKASASYGSGQRLEMRGAQSGGPNSYRFGSLGLTQKVDIFDSKSGKPVPHCFQNLSSIRPLSRWYDHCGLFGHRARRGDSGAFLLNVTATDWYGILTAIDGTEGFFIDANDVLAWARSQNGFANLQVR